MADFPGKVNTQTSPAQTQRRFEIPSNVDVNFIKSIPGILLLLEIFFGLLTWALIASTAYTLYPAYGWVLFVCVTMWLLSIVLFVILLLGMDKKLPTMPWPLVLLVFYAAATVLYLSAFLTDAISVPASIVPQHGHLAASAFFAILVSLLYTASTFFAYLGWKGDGQNADGTTVPV